MTSLYGRMLKSTEAFERAKTQYDRDAQNLRETGGSSSQRSSTQREKTRTRTSLTNQLTRKLNTKGFANWDAFITRSSQTGTRVRGAAPSGITSADYDNYFNSSQRSSLVSKDTEIEQLKTQIGTDDPPTGLKRRLKNKRDETRQYKTAREEVLKGSNTGSTPSSGNPPTPTPTPGSS